MMKWPDRNHARGFTIIELVTVLVLVGILSASILPRFFNTGTYQSRGLYGEVKAALRHAQKRAIAANCRVNFTIVPNTSYGASYDASCPGGVTAVPGFNGGGLGGNSGGLALTTSAPITFTGSGNTTAGANITVTVDTRVITILSGTGYVDAP